MKVLNRNKIKEAQEIIEKSVEDKDALFHLRETLSGELMELELNNLFATLDEINGKHSKKITSLNDFHKELENLGKSRKKIIRRRRRK